MADTPRTLGSLITAAADNTTGLYSAQNQRDFITSVNTLLELWNTPSYADEAAATAGGVPSHGIYRNGPIVQIRLT